MSTQRRLVILLVVVIAVMTMLLIAFQGEQRHQLESLFRDRADQEGAVLDRVLRMNEHAFSAHVTDYSRWDEMVRYVKTHDPGWARMNLDPAIKEFDLDEVWVLDAAFVPLAALHSADHAALRRPPMQPRVLAARLAMNPFQHAFATTPAGTLEYWTSPIQPTADTSRTTTPVGYYVVGRMWDRDVLGQLSELAGGRASCFDAARAHAAARRDLANGVIELDRPLLDLEGHPVAMLRMTTLTPSFRQSNLNAARSLGMFGLMSLGVIGLAYAFIARWVTRPLRRIRAALRMESPQGLDRLARRPDEFGSLAQLIIGFFTQRDAMVGEVRERRRAEMEAAAQKDFVRQVLDGSPNPVYVVDGVGRIVLANTSAHDAFGAAPDSLPGRDIAEVLEPLGCAPSFQRERLQVIETGGVHQVEELVTRPDGTVRRYQSTRGALRRHGGDTPVVTISVDVTKRVLQQLELQRAKEAAEAAGSAKAQFFANVSHELRTPMHGILSYARFGLREWGTAERNELQDYFQNIHDCGQSLLELLNDLLDLAKLESGRMTFDFAEMDLVEIIDSALVEFEPLVRERDLRLVANTSLMPPPVRGDRGKLLQVIRNLLSNAAKFTPQGRTIEVTVAWNGDRVRASVLDEGSGVPEADLEAIFDKYIQSGGGRSTTGGTGLGLAICREILTAHGGTIWAENMPGGGACFTMELPRADAAVVPLPGANAAAAPAAPPVTHAGYGVDETVDDRAA